MIAAVFGICAWTSEALIRNIARPFLHADPFYVRSAIGARSSSLDSHRGPLALRTGTPPDRRIVDHSPARSCPPCNFLPVLCPAGIAAPPTKFIGRTAATLDSLRF